MSMAQPAVSRTESIGMAKILIHRFPAVLDFVMDVSGAPQK